MTARLAVLVSGRGSNLDAILDACAAGTLPARVIAVICDRPGAKALGIAAARGVPATTIDSRGFAERAEFDATLDAELARHAPDFVVLAGFMRILTDGFVKRWLGKLVNIHPSLLPAYPGLGTHRRALADRATLHGATVHFVTPALDSGPAVLQVEVPVRPDDTEALLASRVLHAEHRLYPEALRRIVTGQVAFRDGAVYCGGALLARPERLPHLHS
jgi:phosphoribosylglycinamide formyltransferase-1